MYKTTFAIGHKISDTSVKKGDLNLHESRAQRVDVSKF